MYYFPYTLGSPSRQDISEKVILCVQLEAPDLCKTKLKVKLNKLTSPLKTKQKV